MPVRVLSYVISQIHYGGSVTSEQDSRIAQEALATYLDERVFDTMPAPDRPFNLCGDESPTGDLKRYVMPRPGSLGDYTAHLSSLPSQDSPGIFGLHENAQLSLIEKEGESLLTRMHDVEFGTRSTPTSPVCGISEHASASAFKRHKTKLTDVENKIPDPIDTRLLEKNFKITYEGSISIMIRGEVTKYNNLVSHLKSQVSILLQCLDGETLFDAGMEAVL